MHEGRITEPGLPRAVRVPVQSPHRLVFLLLLMGALLPAGPVTAFLLVLALQAAMQSNASIVDPIRTPLKLAAALIVIGLLQADANGVFDALKDFWYFSNYIVIMLVGGILARRKVALEDVLIGFVWGGIALSIVYLLQVAVGFVASGYSSVDSIRNEAGAGYFASFLSLVLVIVMRKAGMGVRALKGRVVLIQTVNTAAILVSFSRAMWLSLLIALFIARGYSARRALVPLTFTAAIVAALALAVPESAMADRESLVGSIATKMLSSVSEVAFSDYAERADINANWRGYESFMALQTYLDGGTFQLVFGHGLGKLVDLDIEINLGGTDFSSIPILHNGYMYVLVKTGAAGIVVYVLLLATMFRQGGRATDSGDRRLVIVGRLAMAMVSVLAFTTFVISGPFNKQVLFPVLLLLGCMLGLIAAARPATSKRGHARNHARALIDGATPPLPEQGTA